MPWLVKGLATLVGAFAGWLVRKEMNIILGFFFRKFNEGFEWLTVGYIGLIRVLLSIGVLVLIGYGGLLVLTAQVFQQLPTGFIPAQDKGYLLVNVQLPDAASLGRTDAVLRQIEEIAMKTDGVKHAITVSGQSILLGANSSNFGSAYIMLDKFENRTRPELYGEAIAARLQAEFKRQITGAVINVFGAPPVDGLGTAGGFKIVIQDTGSMGLKILQEVGDQVVMDGQQADELQGVYTGFRADTPWLYLELDRVAAQQMGVTMDEITNSLQGIRLALRQRLQPLWPNLAGKLAGRGQIPKNARRSQTPARSQYPRRDGPAGRCVAPEGNCRTRVNPGVTTFTRR